MSGVQIVAFCLSSVFVTEVCIRPPLFHSNFFFAHEKASRVYHVLDKVEPSRGQNRSSSVSGLCGFCSTLPTCEALIRLRKKKSQLIFIITMRSLYVQPCYVLSRFSSVGGGATFFSHFFSLP